VLLGGWAPDFWRRDERFKAIVRDVAKDPSKVLAPICHGPWLLCSACVLQGKRLTCFPAIRDDVENAGGEYVDEEVVVDGNLITSRVPDDLPAFCKAIIAALQKQ
jgi:protease I